MRELKLKNSRALCKDTAMWRRGEADRRIYRDSLM